MAEKKRKAKKRTVTRAWRIGYDKPDGSRVSIEGDNRQTAVLDEVVIGDWLHIKMMNDKPECYWMRVGIGKNERVFTIYIRNGVRVV